MNTDIRVSVSFRGHRKRKKLQRLLGPEAVLCLIDLWIVSAMTRPDGVLSGMDIEDIALDAGWDGDAGAFVDGLIAVGFLDVHSDGVYALHDWGEHNSYASAADDRSDKARFSRLRQAYPELYVRLYRSGVRAISKEEYQGVVGDYLEGVNGESSSLVDCSGVAVASPEQSIGDATGSAGDPLAPSPSPSPSPSLQKKIKALCDDTKKIAGDDSAPGGAARASPGAKDFGLFWEAFADKRGKEGAWKAWKRIKGLDAALVERIVAGAARYAAHRQAIIDRDGTPKMAQGWLSDRRWEDEVIDPVVQLDINAPDPELVRKAVAAAQRRKEQQHEHVQNVSASSCC